MPLPNELWARLRDSAILEPDAATVAMARLLTATVNAELGGKVFKARATSTWLDVFYVHEWLYTDVSGAIAAYSAYKKKAASIVANLDLEVQHAST